MIPEWRVPSWPFEEDRVGQEAPRAPDVEPVECRPAVVDLALDDAEGRRGGPGAGERPVPEERDTDRARRAVHGVDGHADLEQRALTRRERLARDRVAHAVGHAELREGEGRIRASEERVHAPALHRVEHGALRPLGDEEDRLHGPDALAGADAVEPRLAHRPRGAAPLARRVLAEELVPAPAAEVEARRVLVDGPERRVAKGTQQVVGIRIRLPRNADGAEPLLAAVPRLRQRPHRHAAQSVDVLDERLVRGETEVAVGRIGIAGEGPRTSERERAHRAEQPAREPAPASDDDDGVADPLDRPTLLHEQERARDEEEAGDEVERGRPGEPTGRRVPGHRQRGQLVEREVARRERGVHVEHRRQPLELRGARRGQTAEERHHEGSHARVSHNIRFSRTSASYTAHILASATAVENASARSIAASPSFRRSGSSRPSSMSARASAAGSSGGTSRPHSPSTITAGIPPTAAPTTGIPSAIASTRARPIPSLRDGAATTSAAARDVTTSLTTPVTCRRSATPSAVARRSSAARSGPSPTSRRRADGTAARRRGSASTRRSKPLIGTRRPNPATRYAWASTPRRARATGRDGAVARSRAVGTPLGTVTYCAGRPIPRARCSSVPRSVSVMMRSHQTAARRSSAV